MEIKEEKEIVIGRIDHMGLSVKDLAAQIKWYSNVFNMKIEQEVERDEPKVKLVLLRAPSGLGIELMERDGSQKISSHANALDMALDLGYGHWCIIVEDVVSAYNTFMKAGAISVTKPGPSIKPGIHYAYIKDPEENLIEIIQLV